MTENLASEMTVQREGPGRPALFPAEHVVWQNILRGISEGKSLSSTLRADGMPSYSLARQMIKNNPEFRAAYEKAVEDRADRLAEEIIELSDKELPDGLEGSMASAWVQQKRLQVEARKWVAAKLKPKTYGDRIDVAVTDHRISITGALSQAKQRLLKDVNNIVDVESKQA